MELELASEGHQGAHEVGARPGRHPREQGVGPLVFIFCEDFSLFFLRCSVEFQDISRIFIFCTKNNTMAVLLKTASVRVSSIQIKQVRVQNKGKSFWKSRYDGDVSTPPSLDLTCPQAEADNEKYVHMFRDRGVDKNKIRT